MTDEHDHRAEIRAEMAASDRERVRRWMNGTHEPDMINTVLGRRTELEVTLVAPCTCGDRDCKFRHVADWGSFSHPVPRFITEAQENHPA